MHIDTDKGDAGGMWENGNKDRKGAFINLFFYYLFIYSIFSGLPKLEMLT